MSDLCMYELDDNIWDEFGENDDGIVPHSAYAYGDQLSVLASSRKKPRHEAMGSETNNEDSHVFLTKEGVMLEKAPWPQTTNCGSLPACDVGSGKDVHNIKTGNPKVFSNDFHSGQVDAVDDEFCTAGPLLGDSAPGAHDSLYNFPLSHIPQSENSLSFFDSDCNDKESDDLFYGWTDIGNFEDVDKMFRSCDSTFGLGSLNGEDDLCWFSNSQPAEESEAIIADDSKPSNILENHGDCRLKNEDSWTNKESSQSNVVKEDSQSTVAGDSALGDLSVDANTNPQKKDVLILVEQANLNKKQAKRVHYLDGKRNRSLENGVSLHQSDESKQIIDTKYENGNPMSQYDPSSTFQRPGAPYSQLKYDHPSEQMSGCQTNSCVKSENNLNPSSASNESYASNQAHSLESLHGTTVDAPGVMAFEKRGKMQQGKDMHPVATSVRNGKKPNMLVFSESKPVQKIEGDKETILVADAPVQLDSSNAQESSCVSSFMDDISLEATSFRQLQQVIEQLDVRTKLCIRDSLYRLAKSAEQRHNCMNTMGGARNEKDADSQPVTSDTDKYAGFMDVETDTNPIDRSIAHLLFHRPSDPSLVLENDILSYKSHPMILQPNSSPSLRIEKQEEPSAAEIEKQVPASDKK